MSNSERSATIETPKEALAEEVDEVERALSRDPLYEAQQITGKRWDEDKSEQTVLLGFLIANEQGKQRNALLSARGDTRHGISPEEYGAIARDIGFAEMLRVPFESKYSKDEYLSFLWRPDGFLLRFETFMQWNSVNDATLYYDLKVPRDIWVSSRGLTSSGHGHDVGDGFVGWCGNHGVLEGLRHTVGKLEPFVVPQWADSWYVNFCHFAEPNQDDREHRKSVNVARCALLGEVGKMIADAGGVR